MRDSIEEREAKAEDSEGELKESVGALPRVVVAAACGIGSLSDRVARLKTRIEVRNIFECFLLIVKMMN